MEEAVNELKMANLTVNKLGETFDSFQSHAFSIAALSEQWRALKSSFSVVESSLVNRVKEIESKERNLVATEKRIENLEREVALKRKRVDERAADVELSEKQICDRYEVVKIKEKEVIAFFEGRENELIDRFDEKAAAIDVRSKALEVKEKELTERFERCRREIEEKAKATVDERSRDLELKEKELIERFKEKKAAIDVRSKALKVKEKELTERFERFRREIQGKATVVDEKSKALELKEKELTERFERFRREIQGKATVVDEKSKALELKEKELIEHFKEEAAAMDVRSKALEMKEKELTERFERCRREIEGCRREIEEKATVVDERSKALEVIEKELIERFQEKATAIDERSKYLEVKEKMIESFDKVRKEFEIEYEEKKLGIDERLKELELKEKEMNERFEELKVLELREKEVDERVRDLVSKGTELNELIHEYNVKVTRVDEEWKDIEVKEKQIVRRRKVVELKEKDLDDKLRGCELRMEENDQFRRELDSKEREIEECSKMLELKESDLDDKLRGFALRMEENNQFRRELDSKKKEIEECSKMLELKEKEVNEQCQVLELIKKEIDERSKMLELKEKELKHDSIVCKMNGSRMCDRIGTLCRDVDANGLISYLNEHVNDHTELHDEVLDALRFASNPAKLVLDVCKTFHGPYSTKLVTITYQTSCIYLLELLMELKPEITLDVSNEARKLADVWRSRLGCDDTRGNFRFLLFLAAYKLSSLYEVEVIAEHLIRLYSEENIYQAEKHVTLRNALGIADKVPDIIQNLIGKHQPLEAIRLAHAFELFHKFPPVPLLESYLSSTFTKAEKVRRRQDPSKEAQIKYLTTKIGALNFVVRCIKKYDLMSEFPIQPLENLSLELKREKMCLTRVSSLNTETEHLTASADPKPNVGSGNSTSLITPFRGMKNEVPSHDFVHSSVTSGSILDGRLQSMSRNKRPRLFTLQRHQPVNPHLVRHGYIPVCNWGAVPNYGNYTWPFNSHQSLHHP